MEQERIEDDRFLSLGPIRNEPASAPFAPMAVSLVTLNDRPRLERCVASLFDMTPVLGAFKLFVTDRGSNEPTRNFLLELQAGLPNDVDVTFLAEDPGVAAARNAHWEKCQGYDVFRVDSVAEIGTLNYLNILRTQSHALHGGIGLYSKCIRESFYRAGHKKFPLPQTVIPYELIQGLGMFIPRDCVDALGYWNECYVSLAKEGFEDIDYSIRMNLAGYATYVTRMVVVHELTGSTERSGIDEENLGKGRMWLDRNTKLWKGGHKSLCVVPKGRTWEHESDEGDEVGSGPSSLVLPERFRKDLPPLGHGKGMDLDGVGDGFVLRPGHDAERGTGSVVLPDLDGD